MEKKRRAAEKAAEMVENGMLVGLGTGSTAHWMIQKLGQRLKEGLNIRAVPTSEYTKQLARSLDIPLVTLEEVDDIDLTIDGADEIDPAFNLIKGGGGALFREKMVALHSKQLIIVADDSKRVNQLGKFLLPVEVVPFGWGATAKEIEKLGCKTALRRSENRPFVTDNGNWILDCDFGRIVDPAHTHQLLKMLTGVVETGLFIEAADLVIIGTDNDVLILKKNS